MWKDQWVIIRNPEMSCKNVVHFLEMCGISEIKITLVSMKMSQKNVEFPEHAPII